MGIDDFLRKTDEPTAIVSYPIREVYRGAKGTSILGLSPDVLGASLNKEIVPPVQVVRRPGLGDKIFALAALHTFLEENPGTDITFSGLDTDIWLKQIPWVKTGINFECNTIVNLDNVRCNGGDRAQIMGEALGVEVEDIRFPIDVPKKSSYNLHLPKKYYVFAPFAARNGPRSIPMKTVIEILSNSPVPLAFKDVERYNLSLSSNVYNATGTDMLDTLVLLRDCAGVIGCDSGIPWLAAAMNIPALVFMSHVSRLERAMTTRNVWAIETPAPCLCGDHVNTRPECRWKEKIPACALYLTPELVRYSMIEFDRMAR